MVTHLQDMRFTHIMCLFSSDYRQAANIIMINPLYDIMSQTVYIITPSREEKFKSFHSSPRVLD